MEECAHPRREARITYVVDGGYIDRTGAAAMLDLWHAIEPEVRRRKRQGDCLVPVFVQLENSYERLATAPAGSRPGELTVPLRAYGEAGADRQWVVSAQAQRAFGPQHYVRLAPTRRPGVQAPLGWVLSGTAQRDLDEQRQKLRSDPRVGWHRLRKLLEGRTPCPRR
jgi:hypothetical protein